MQKKKDNNKRAKNSTKERSSQTISTGYIRIDDEQRRIRRRKREMQVRKQRRRLIMGSFAACFVIAACAFAFLYMNPLFLKAEVIQQEMAEDFNPTQNIGFVFGGKVKQVQVESSVDTSKPGDYEVTYTYRGHKKKATVEVRDTTKPELELQTYATDLAETITPELFVKEVKDASEVKVRFEKEEKWDQAKTYEIGIVAEDASGNETIKKTKLIREKDEKGPEITGADDVDIMQGKDLDLQNGVTVSDNMDPNPSLSVNTDQVDLNSPGTYTAVYTAKDRSGNETTVERKIVVEENPELEEKIVYLTFDDGPSENTGKILDILKKYNAKATFFVTGNNQKHDDLMKRAHDEGHSIGLHTYTHDYAKLYASEEAYFDDLQKISDLVEKVTGEKSYLIRFPGGSSNTVSKKYVPGLMTKLTKAVQEKGYQYFDWNCDSTDAEGNNRPVEKLVANATSSSQKHINILMHDTDAKDTTVEALPKIIEYYRAKGYTFKGLTANSFAPHHKVNN